MIIRRTYTNQVSRRVHPVYKSDKADDFSRALKEVIRRDKKPKKANKTEPMPEEWF